MDAMTTSALALADPEYQARVGAALDAAWERARPGPAFDLAADRWIIFSDQHKGARNGADDFLRGERAYNAALAYYHQLGYTLVALGDVEELWEETPAAVVRAYPYTLELEARFQRAGRYLRVWGNHDDDWARPELVRRYLGPFFGAELAVAEGLRVSVRAAGAEIGTLFLAHGHQGDPASDAWSSLSRLAVRYFWRPFQRLTHLSVNTPATDWQLRERHNIALYTWAQRQSKRVLIAGHTHRPVFRSQTHAEQVQRLLADLEARHAAAPDDRRLAELMAKVAAELEWVRAQDFRAPGPEGAPQPMSTPCYFNTGCCCFADGDITGLELAGGEIRLVRWPDRHGRPRPQVLASAALPDVFAAC